MLRPVSCITALLGLATVSACKSDKDGDSAGACEAPTASAGADLAVALGDTVTLDGSASSVCQVYLNDGSASYAWSFEAVPAGSAVDDSALSDNGSPSSVSPSFIPDVEGDYVLSLTVSDPAFESSPDLVVVSVQSGDLPPVADCGANLAATAGDLVALDGSASADPEGAELTWSWSLSSVPTCSTQSSTDIYNGSGPTPTVVPDCEGIFVVSLVVSDGNQWSDPDYCSIDVASDNRIPVADAGDPGDLSACADNPLQLNGYGSYDLDADELSYRWSVVSVPSTSTVTDASFNDTTSAAPYVTWDERGTYVFQLEVYDGTDWSAPDIVTLTIVDDETNNSPVANAGDDISVESTAECTSSSYVWTCGDCEAVTTELDGSASDDIDGDDVSYYWSESTGALSFSNRYSSVTDVTVPAQAAAYGDTTTVYVVSLDVADCIVSDNDTLDLTYTCTGER
jgi:hypothetical protein